MNVYKLARLAKQNNETLVILVNRWMLKEKNPIRDIQIKSRVGMLWRPSASLVVILFILFLITIKSGFSHDFSWVVSPNLRLILGIAFCFCLAFFIVIGCMIVSLENKIENRENVKEFLYAISLIEHIYQQAGILNDMWCLSEFSVSAGTISERYLHLQAKRLKELERIPWRKKEEHKFRTRFDKEFEVLTLLLLLPTDRKLYFEPKEVAVVS